MKKKIIGAVLAALMLGGAIAVSAADSADDTIVLNADNGYELNLKINLIGDVNENGSVNFLDLQRLFVHLSTADASQKLKDYALKLGDANQNGSVNFLDLQRLFVHLSTTDPNQKLH